MAFNGIQSINLTYRSTLIVILVHILSLQLAVIFCSTTITTAAQPSDNNPRTQSSRTEVIQIFNASDFHVDPSIPRHNLIFTVLLTLREDVNENDCILPKVMPALELAIKQMQRLGFPGVNFDVTLISRDTFCSSIFGAIGFFEIYWNWHDINAVFGLSCDYVLAPVSRYSGVWEIPVFSTAGRGSVFDTKKPSYPTLTRLMGGLTGTGNVLRFLLDGFEWTRSVLIYESVSSENAGFAVCYFCAQAVHVVLEKKSIYQIGFDKHVLDKANITMQLQKIAKIARIVIMCADPNIIRQIMLTAEELKMIDNGEYVFINIELFSRVPLTLTQPWYDKNDTDENNERARKAYTAVLTVTPKQPDDDEYIRVSNEIKAIASSKYNYTFQENEPLSAFVTSFYDGVLLYANALNESIKEDPTILAKPINGTDIVRRMWNRSFNGITGNVTIDSNGDRISTYSLLDMNPVTGRFETVANFLHNRLEYIDGKSIHWAGDRIGPPPDVPECGYDGSLCPNNALPGYAILSIVLGLVVFVMAIGFVVGYRHYKSEAEINSMTWKVSMDEVIYHESGGRYIRGSFHSLVKHSSQLTLMSECSFNADRQIFVPVGLFRGCKVAIKKISERNINLNRSLMLDLKRMKDMQHDHLVKFYGACLDPSKSFLLTEYCPKGSLQDILENEQFQLDWMFKLSLMHDIVRGMQFLHNSDIRSHGNLKSSNCVVDSRFVLKITDFGLHSLRKPHPKDDIEKCNSHAYWSNLLWTAPELLNMKNRPPEGTQKGDVYSFSIIVHEITTRQGPFYLGKNEVEKSPQEIIELVKGYACNTINHPYRPHIDETASYEDINNIMQKCWSEEPTERPDFQALKSIIRKINKNNETGNIVDNLLKRMEQYANNLEELVEERTQDYIEEKKKCEKLLYQLLPQSVAAQLISGQPVVAETFDQVTIYFSDIVGFTAISAESTPMQVVQFLNDLYTCFDSIVENFDVYKVETIGDAYMVVSGLPIRNGNQHAREIARLALALLDAVHNFEIHHRPDDKLKLRIGLHTGACVAGVVGQKMPRYCLFGDTVNTASRMESNGEALRIHISQTTKVSLDQFGTFITTERGLVPMKGKGEMLTYWLEGEKQPTNIRTAVPFKEYPRRASLKLKSSLKHNNSITEISHLPPPYTLQHHPHQNSPMPASKRMHRKISSSSPKLNGGDFKTDEYKYFLDSNYAQMYNNRQGIGGEIYSSRSLAESNLSPGDGTTSANDLELANFRLPLAVMTKQPSPSPLTASHNNNPCSRAASTNSTPNSILNLNTNSLQLNSLKTSTSLAFTSAGKTNLPATASSAVTTLDDNSSITSGNNKKIIKYNSQPERYHHHSNSNLNYNLGKSSNKMINCVNMNNFAKNNSVQNMKTQCNNSARSNSIGGGDDSNVNRSVTQPLLTRINS